MFHRFRAVAPRTQQETAGGTATRSRLTLSNALQGVPPTPPASARHPQAPIPTRRLYSTPLWSWLLKKTSIDIICCEAWQKPRGWRRVWWRRVNASCAVERCASPDSARLRARSLGRLARDIHSLTFPRRAHPAGGSGRCTAAMREGRCPRASMCTRLA